MQASKNSDKVQLSCRVSVPRWHGSCTLSSVVCVLRSSSAPSLHASGVRDWDSYDEKLRKHECQATEELRQWKVAVCESGDAMNSFWARIDGKIRNKAAQRAVLVAAAVVFFLPLTAHAQDLNYNECKFLPDATFCTIAAQLNSTVQNTGGDLIISSGTTTQTTDLTLGTNTELIAYTQCTGSVCNSLSDTYDVPTSLVVGPAATYDLEAGTLSAPLEVINGTMNQTGGANQLTDAQAVHIHCFDNSCSTVESIDTIGTLDVDGGNYNLTGGTVQTPILITEGGGTFTQNGGNVTVLPNLSSDSSQPTGSLDGALYVGLNGSGTYNLQNGTLQVGGSYTFACGSVSGTCTGFANGNEYVGYNAGSNGVFNQSGGTNLMGPPSGGASSLGGSLYVGYMGNGTYNLSGGTMATSYPINEYIGNEPGSTGTFNQTGGVNGVNISTSSAPNYSILQLFVGYTGQGNYVLGNVNGSAADASLSADYEEIGTIGLNPLTSQLAAGTGTFVQNSGTNAVSILYVGEEGNTIAGTNFSVFNPQGTYTLNGGVLSAGEEYVGVESVGIFVQNGGTNQTQSLEIATGNTSYAGDAAYALTNGTLTVCCSSEIIGQGSNTDGIFNQSGGLHQALEIVLGNGGQGSYSLSGGTLDGSFITVGQVGGNGLFEQSGGVVDLLATFQYNGQTEGGAGVLQVGDSASGTYDLGCLLSGGICTPGTGSLNAGQEEIGLTINTSLVGTFNQYAGTTNTITRNGLGTGSLDVGEDGQGVYNQFGGTLSVNTENLGYFAGTGTFNQSGGTNNAVLGTYGTGVLNVGNSGTGTYNLSGASTGPSATTLNAVNENVGVGGGVGNFNQTGGVNNVSGTLIVGGGDVSSGEGYYIQSGGSLTASNEVVGNNFAATSILSQGFIQTGGTNTVSGTLTIGASNSVQNALGVYGLENGTLSADNVTVGNGGVLNINPTAAPNQAGSVTMLVAGTLLNNGTVNIFSSPSTHFTNEINNFVGNAAFNFDAVTLNLGNVNIGANGYLNGVLGDQLDISGNFFNNSIQGSLWNTGSVTLDFGMGLHEVFSSTGSSGTMFNWGDLALEAGASLDFSSGSGGLFTDAITLGSGSGICGGDVFYDVNDTANSFLNGATDTFSCAGGLTGELIPFDGAFIGQQPATPTPEPATWVLLLSGLSLLALFKGTGKLDS
jgi:fibronectin-binding autotransporter adhesin